MSFAFCQLFLNQLRIAKLSPLYLFYISLTSNYPEISKIPPWTAIKTGLPSQAPVDGARRPNVALRVTCHRALPNQRLLASTHPHTWEVVKNSWGIYIYIHIIHLAWIIIDLYIESFLGGGAFWDAFFWLCKGWVSMSRHVGVATVPRGSGGSCALISNIQLPINPAEINKELHHHFPVLAFDASSGTRYAEAGSLHHDTFCHPSSCDAGKYSPWTEWRACMRMFFTSTVSTHACEFIILRMLNYIEMCNEYLHLIIINNMEKYPQTSASYGISRSI